MTKKYKFKYDYAECVLEVDYKIFTKEKAIDTLSFFVWSYDKDADPIVEVLKKYAIEIFRQTVITGYNKNGIILEFKSIEGFYNIDGTDGITLIELDPFEFDEDNLRFSETKGEKQ